MNNEYQTNQYGFGGGRGPDSYCPYRRYCPYGGYCPFRDNPQGGYYGNPYNNPWYGPRRGQGYGPGLGPYCPYR